MKIMYLGKIKNYIGMGTLYKIKITVNLANKFQRKRGSGSY